MRLIGWQFNSKLVCRRSLIVMTYVLLSIICVHWRPNLSIGLAVVCFYSKTRFWPSYCQISTDLDKILHTPIVVRNTLVERLRLRSACGRLQAKSKRLFFVILATHPKSYIETTDRRNFGGNPSKWRWGRVLSWKKNPEFYIVGGARSKTAFFRVFTVPSAYRKQFYPNQWYRWKAETLKVYLLLVWRVCD